MIDALGATRSSRSDYFMTAVERGETRRVRAFLEAGMLQPPSSAPVDVAANAEDSRLSAK